jgi:hypothetical protein
VGDCGLRNPPGIISVWSFPSVSVYFRGAENLCVHKEESSAARWKDKHEHNHHGFPPPIEFPPLRSFLVLSNGNPSSKLTRRQTNAGSYATSPPSSTGTTGSRDPLLRNVSLVTANTDCILPATPIDHDPLPIDRRKRYTSTSG